MSPMAQTIRCLIGTAIGAVPGLLIAYSGTVRPGLAVAAIGAVMGLLCAFEGLSIGRTLKLFLAAMIGYNVPGTSDRLHDWVDESAAGEEGVATNPSNLSDAFAMWVFGHNARGSSPWIVIWGLTLGLVLGTGLGAYDLTRLAVGEVGLVLPFPRIRNVPDHWSAFVADAFGLAALTTVWTGAIAGMFAGPLFRRQIPCAAGFAGFLSGMIYFAQSGSPGPKGGLWGFLGVFTTIAVGMSLCICLLMSLFPDQPELEGPTGNDTRSSDPPSSDSR